MKNTIIVSFPQRNDSLSMFCPFCGTHTLELEEVTECEHLQLVHFSAADEPFLYINPNHKGMLSEAEHLEEVLVRIDTNTPQGKYIGFNEVESGGTPYETLVLFDSQL